MQPPVWPQGTQEPDTRQSSPSDNTGYAPELRRERSRNLYRRDLDFWQPVPQPPQPLMPDMQQTQFGRPKDEHYDQHPKNFKKTRSSQPKRRHAWGYGQTRPVRRPGSHALQWLLGIILVLTIAGVIGWNTLLGVENITVEGNRSVSAEEIIRLSGLKPGMNRFSFKPEEVTRRIEQNQYLVCELVHLSDWNTIHIRVSERYPVAAVEYNGMVALTDLCGRVLEKEELGKLDTSQLIKVSGMSVTYCEKGADLVTRNAVQMQVYQTIMLELRTLNVLSWIRELNMNSMDSLYLVTYDDYSVHLGSYQSIHEKIRAMTLVMGQLRGTGQEAGTLDVTAPSNPSYIPDSALMSSGSGK